ncbi:hypothetical protein [uncultured Gammaproteobacteria bacterium]|nr:hypothetical protein [uncultured Gammaproteobacteria bacterium]
MIFSLKQLRKIERSQHKDCIFLIKKPPLKVDFLLSNGF